MRGQPTDNGTDEFSYGPDRIRWFEQFEVSPVAPNAVERRLDGGAVLETLDLPTYLDRELAGPDASIALYRLVQLFGTPNVPGLEAGADQPDREQTTWQYLLDATYEPGDEGPGPGEERELLLSVYDFRTNFSVGLSSWRTPAEPPGRPVPEPTDDSGRLAVPPAVLDDEEFLVGLVQLVLGVVEHPVQATYKDLAV